MGLPAVVVMKNPNERLAFSVSVRRGEQRWAGHASAIAILTKAATPTLVDCRKVSRRGKWQFFRARFYRGARFRISLILSHRNLVGECLPQTLPCGLRRLKIPQNIFSDFSKQFRFTPCFSPISERTPRTAERRFLPCENDITRRTAAG